MVEAGEQLVGRVGLEVGVCVELGREDCCVNEGDATVAVVAELVGVPGCDVVDSHLQVDSGDHLHPHLDPQLSPPRFLILNPS